jgi:hypothetical protein
VGPTLSRVLPGQAEEMLAGQQHEHILPPASCQARFRAAGHRVPDRVPMRRHSRCRHGGSSCRAGCGSRPPLGWQRPGGRSRRCQFVGETVLAQDQFRASVWVVAGRRPQRGGRCGPSRRKWSGSWRRSGGLNSPARVAVMGCSARVGGPERGGQPRPKFSSPFVAGRNHLRAAFVQGLPLTPCLSIGAARWGGSGWSGSVVSP